MLSLTKDIVTSYSKLHHLLIEKIGKFKKNY